MRITFSAILGAASSLAIAAATPAHAQQASAEAQEAPSDAPSGGLEDIVVTAQKRAQSVQDVPISISVLSATAIERGSIKAASDLPSISPALTYTTGAVPSFATFNIRGIGSYVYRIGIQPAVSVVVDGVPLARTAEFAGELGDVERVEVLSGPQGTLFGRNATGGAINIVRKAPTDTVEGYVAGELIAGEQGDVETLVKGVVNAPITDGVKLRLFGYHRRNSDYIKNYNNEADDAGQHRVYGFQGKLAIDLGPDLDLLISGDYLHDNSRLGSASVFIPLQAYQLPTVPDITARQIALQGRGIGDPFAITTYQPFTNRQKMGGGVADLTWRPTAGLTIKSLTSYRKAALDALSPIYFQSVLDPQNFPFVSLRTNGLNDSGQTRVTRWHYFTQEVRAEYASDLVDATVGVYHTNLKETEFGENATYLSAEGRGPAFVALIGTPTGANAAFPYYYSNQITDTSDRNKVFAGFADVTFHPADGLDLFVGYRRSHETLSFTYKRDAFSNLPIRFGNNFDRATWTPTVPYQSSFNFGGSKSETQWAGRAGLSYELMPGSRAYATASRGYVGSGVDQGNAPRTISIMPLDPGNSFIRPSVAKNYEVGFKTEIFDRRLRLNIALFKTDTSDVQVTALVPGTNTNIVQNAGDIRAKGLEINFDAQPVEALNISGGFSYLDAKIRNLSQRCYPNQANEPGARPCVGNQQSVDGTAAINSPKYKGNIAATYTIAMPDQPFDLYLRGDFQYRSKAWFQLDHDPLATQDGYGLLNLTLGLTTHDEKLDVRFFVNNVTNKYYCNNMVNGPFFRQGCQSSPIGAQRRLGVAVKAGF